MRQWARAAFLVALLVGSGVTSCRGARRLAADAAAGDSIPCRPGSPAAASRIDSLGIRARRAGDRGDLAVLHAVSDTLDSLERLAGRPCRPDTSHAVR